VQTGAVVVREWDGVKYQVTVLKDGFMFKGAHMASGKVVDYVRREHR
jgi:hypothetical protein